MTALIKKHAFLVLGLVFFLFCTGFSAIDTAPANEAVPCFYCEFDENGDGSCVGDAILGWDSCTQVGWLCWTSQTECFVWP